MNTTATLPKSIVVIGRRWFQRGPGNTYNTAEIIVDGVTVAKTPRQYGYGDHYADIALEYMEANGIIPARNPEQRQRFAHWQWVRDLGITYQYSAVDVARQKDL